MTRYTRRSHAQTQQETQPSHDDGDDAANVWSWTSPKRRQKTKRPTSAAAAANVEQCRRRSVASTAQKTLRATAAREREAASTAFGSVVPALARQYKHTVSLSHDARSVPSLPPPSSSSSAASTPPPQQEAAAWRPAVESLPPSPSPPPRIVQAASGVDAPSSSPPAPSPPPPPPHLPPPRSRRGQASDSNAASDDLSCPLRMYDAGDAERMELHEEKLVKAAESPTWPQRRLAVQVVSDFVRERRRPVNGGAALHELLRRVDPSLGLYEGDGEPADIDFYSDKPIQDTIAICNRLHALGVQGVKATEAAHPETYTVKVGDTEWRCCDCSYMEHKTLEALLRTAAIDLGDGLFVVHPHFMLIDYLRAMNDPVISFGRVGKTFRRLVVMQDIFPLPPPPASVSPPPPPKNAPQQTAAAAAVRVHDGDDPARRGRLREQTRDKLLREFVPGHRGIVVVGGIAALHYLSTTTTSSPPPSPSSPSQLLFEEKTRVEWRHVLEAGNLPLLEFVSVDFVRDCGRVADLLSTVFPLPSKLRLAAASAEGDDVGGDGGNGDGAGDAMEGGGKKKKKKRNRKKDSDVDERPREEEEKKEEEEEEEREAGVLTYQEYRPFFDFTGRRGEFCVDGVCLVRVLDHHERCVPYAVFRPQGDGEEAAVQLGTFTVTVMFLLMERFQHGAFKGDARVTWAHDALVYALYRERNAFLRRHGLTVFDPSPFQEFVLTCAGQAKPPNRRKQEIVDWKKTHNMLPCHFKYEPARPTNVFDGAKYCNTSGNVIKNPLEHRFPFEAHVFKRITREERERRRRAEQQQQQQQQKRKQQQSSQQPASSQAQTQAQTQQTRARAQTNTNTNTSTKNANAGGKLPASPGSSSNSSAPKKNQASS